MREARELRALRDVRGAAIYVVEAWQHYREAQARGNPKVANIAINQLREFIDSLDAAITRSQV